MQTLLFERNHCASESRRPVLFFVSYLTVRGGYSHPRYEVAWEDSEIVHFACVCVCVCVMVSWFGFVAVWVSGCSWMVVS